MQEPELRIGLVAPLPPPYGGIGNWSLLVREYARRRDDVCVDFVDISPRWREISDFAVWKRIVGGGAQLVRDFVRFLRLLRKKPHVIHVTTSGQFSIVRDLVILATARIARTPAVFHIRFGRVPEIAQARTYEWRLLALALRMADTVIAIDLATADTIQRRVPQVRTQLIPNGVDLNRLPQSNNGTGERTVLFLGWVIPTKGIEELVSAWSKARIDGWRCVIAGPGSDGFRQDVQRRFSPVGLEFLPEQSHEDAMRLMAAADVFVLPSHTEGFPNVVVEAMAFGKPIVATSVGAIPEMLAGNCGLVVPPHDAVALGDALRDLCGNSSLRTELGVRAQAKARSEYSMERVMEQLMAVWRNAARKMD